MSSGEESVEKSAFSIGWEFVQTYYTFMHKEPEQLYKFYGNNSYLCNGLEGESTPYCHGIDEIRKRIDDVDYKKCKVVVSNIDSQPSSDGGIIVQVLGELINKDEQVFKFAQTFFLAVQEGGYYVLNDIFRHLKDEVNEENDESIQQAEEKEEEEDKNEPAKIEEPKETKPEKVTESKETKPALAEEPKPAPAKEKKTAAEAVASKPATATKPAPTAAVAAKEATPAPAKEKEAASTTAAPEASKPTAAKVAAAAADAKPTTTTTTTTTTATRPITYSSIASSPAKSWSKVAQGDGTGKPSAAIVVKQSATTTQKHSDTKNNGSGNNNNGNNTQDKDSHTVFIKLPMNFNNVSKVEISNALNKYGEIKNVEINTQKNYVFVEFATVEQARKAIQAGEFTYNNTRINIEERRRTNKNHGNGRMNSYSNRGTRDYNRNYSGGSRGSNDSNNMGSRRGGSNNGKRPYKN